MWFFANIQLYPGFEPPVILNLYEYLEVLTFLISYLTFLGSEIMAGTVGAKYDAVKPKVFPLCTQRNLFKM